MGPFSNAGIIFALGAAGLHGHIFILSHLPGLLVRSRPLHDQEEAEKLEKMAFCQGFL